MSLKLRKKVVFLIQRRQYYYLIYQQSTLVISLNICILKMHHFRNFEPEVPDIDLQPVSSLCCNKGQEKIPNSFHLPSPSHLSPTEQLCCVLIHILFELLHG